MALPRPALRSLPLLRYVLAAAFVAIATSTVAYAQAPDSGPLVLREPPGTRANALGGAWVAGRDTDVVFYNPAQLIGQRPEFSATFTRHGNDGRGVSLSSAYAGGPWSMTFGFGVQLLDFTSRPGDAYPFSPDVLLTHGSIDGQSRLVTIGGAIVIKGFRIGVAGKYAADHSTMPDALGGPTSLNRHALLADFGVARSIVGGVGAISIQNVGASAIGEAPAVKLPRQALLGWSTTRGAGPLDLGIFTQLTLRSRWTSPAGGLEAGYSWIEGYAVTLRLGARRPEVTAERPVTFGAAFTADRLTVEYAIEFFDGARNTNRISIRWR